jgi:hypothetical protein
VANFTDAFYPENGINLDDLVGIFAGSADPTAGLGEAAPVGSLYLRSNGELWSKTGALDLNWTKFDLTGGGSVTSISTAQPTEGLTITGSPITTAGTLVFTLANDLAAVEGLAGTGFTVRSGVDTWATRVLTQPAAGFTIANNTGTGGNPTFALANDLAAVEDLAGTGFAVRTTADTWVQRAVSGATNQIAVTNGDGVAGNPTIGLAPIGVLGTYSRVTTDLYGRVISGDAIQATDTGGTGLAGIGAANQVLGVNLAGTALEYKTVIAGVGIDVVPTAGTWTISAVNLGTVTSVAAVGSAGLTVGGSPITSTGTLTFTLSPELEGMSSVGAVGIITRTAAGNYTARTLAAPAAGITITNPAGTAGDPTLALANDLEALEGLAGTGFAVRTAADTWAQRTIAGTAGNIMVTNGDGVAGDPTLDLITAGTAGTYGAVTTDTFGRVTAGTVVAPIVNGGTGLGALGTANQLVSVNLAGTALEYRTITTGTGISATSSAGGLALANTGVTSVVGTTNQVIVSGGTGAVTFSLPQSINSTSTPTFAQINVLSNPTSALQLATKQYVDAFSSGLIWVEPIVANGLLSDSLTAPPGTPSAHDAYIVPPGATGAWAGLTGRIVEYSGAMWVDLGAATNSRLGIALESGTPSGPFTGKRNQIVTVTGTYPYTYSYYLPVGSNAVLVNNQLSLDAYHQYAYNAGSAVWVEFAGPATYQAGTGILLSANAISIANTGIAAGTYNSLTINQQGQATAGSNIAYLTANQSITLTGDVTGTGTTSIDTTLSNTGVVAGTYRSVTIDTKGRVIAATNPAVVTSVGLALPSIFTVTGSPVTTAGTLTGTLATQANNTLFAGPTTAGPAVPAFRTISMAQGDLADVLLTAPTSNQVLTYNSGSSKWVNSSTSVNSASGLIGVGQAGAALWVIASGTRYRADFAHNLGTTNVVVSLFDVSNNQLIAADSIVLTDTNTVRVTVIGNTRTLKVVVVANISSLAASPVGVILAQGGTNVATSINRLNFIGANVIDAGGGTGNITVTAAASLATAKDGATVGTAVSKLNWQGNAFSVTDAGGGQTNIVFTGLTNARFSYFANSLDTPTNTDFVITGIAPATTDPTYNAMTVRSFSNTVEQGVAFSVSIPAGATTVTVKTRGRAQTAPGAASVVQPRLYYRRFPNNAAPTAWSGAQELVNIAIPTNAFFQYASQTIALSTLGLTADNLYQFEYTRRVAGVTGTNLASNFLLAEITLEFA